MSAVLASAVIVALVLLIAAVPAVRKAFVRHAANSGQREDDPADAASDEADEAEPALAEETASLDSSEPGYDVLPPGAARDPGRNLPKMLLLGNVPGMFRYLEDAVAAAVPGDIIEIRTNRPLVVAGAECRLPPAPDRRPLTIRGGKGFQPVLRGAGGGAMLTVANIDLTVSDIHFVRAAIRSVGGNLSVRHCSSTLQLDTARGILGFLTYCNARTVPPRPHKLTVDGCLLRGTHFVILSAGSDIAVEVSRSAFVGGHHLVGIQLADRQSVILRETTMVGIALRFLGAPPDSPPVLDPLAFDMSHCVIAAPWMGPMLLYVDGPSTPLPPDVRVTDFVRNSFRRFVADDNLCQFWGFWGQAPDTRLTDSLFDRLPANIGEPIRFRGKLEEARALIHQHRNREWIECLAAALPADLEVQPLGEAGQRLRNGKRYGPDLAVLPTPPAVTLATYKTQVVSVAGADELKIGGHSPLLPVSLEGLEDSGIWFVNEQQLRAVATGPGQWLDLAVRVPRAGRYRVRARLVQGPASGTVAFAVNGERVGKRFDLYATEPGRFILAELGEFVLPKGNTTLRVEVVDTSAPGQQPGYEFGIVNVALRRTDAGR